MFFKWFSALRLSLLFVSLSTSILFTGCNLKVGEEPAKNSDLKVGADEKFACMGQIGITLKGYLRAELSDTNVNEFIDCLNYSFTSFEAYMEGKSENGYHPEELREFLHRHFLKEKVITDGLLSGFMNLKVTLLGGSEEILTRSELKNGVQIIEKLRPIILRLRPLMPVLNPHIGSKTWPELKQQYPLSHVKTELAWAADETAKILDGSAGSYQMQDLEKLVFEFRRFVDWETHFEETRSPESWIELIKVLKGLAIRPPETTIEPQDWRPLLENSTSWYLQYLRFTYQIKTLSLLYGEGLNEINNLFDDSFKLIDRAIQQHDNKVIEIHELDRLFDVLGRLDMLPFDIEADSFKSLMRPLLSRVLGDIQLSPDERKLRGLNRYVLAQALAEFSRWSDIQGFLDRHFTPSLVAQTWQRPSFNIYSSGAFRSYSQDIDRITETIRPLFRDNQKNVFLIEEKKLASYNVTHSFHNLSIMNLIRAAVGLAIRGYSTHLNRSWSIMDSGLTESETQQVYDTLQPIGIDLKFMDPRSSNSGKRSFLEGNLFTYQGDGIQDQGDIRSRDHLMNFEETMELLAFLYSGGNFAERVYSDLLNGDAPNGIQACETSGLGVHGMPRLLRSCVRDQFMTSFIKHAVGMPELANYLSAASKERQLALTDALMDASYNPVNSSEDYVEKSEFSVMVMVAHYSESVMTRYNENADAVLDTDEIWKAYSTFKGFIGKTLRGRCMEPHEGRVREVYRYIISKGALPEENIGTLFDFWVGNVWWSESLDRGRVIEVFASIIKSVVQGGTGIVPSCHAP